MKVLGDSPNGLARKLGSYGFRITAQRRILIDIIEQSLDHLDAARLLHLAKEKDAQIHRATVYRTLGILKRFKLVDELDLMHLEGEKHFYEARTKGGHFHLACFRCGRIMEYSTPNFERLKEEISEKMGFSVDVMRLEVGGQCPRCRKADLQNLERREQRRGRGGGEPAGREIR